jgi:uncharacterized protein (TIGR01777 family)
MIIALAGHRGFIGTHLQKILKEHSFILLNREDLYGDVNSLSQKIEKADAVINLAGFSVSKRWTKKNRKKIRDSRELLTGNLARAMKVMERKPKVFLNSSAIGVYEYDTVNTEEEYTLGEGFLADVVKNWEGAAALIGGDVRTVFMRVGLVLGKDGGALPRLLKLFRFGLGGVIGTGKQVYSFIHIDDVIGAIEHLLNGKGKGIYHITAPQPVTNKEFTRAISRSMKRPVIFRIPVFAMRIVMGRAAMIVTRGHTVYPKRLLDEGYKFTFVTIQEAIQNLVDP